MDVEAWLEKQETGLNIAITKSSRIASFDAFEDRVCMNRSVIQLRKKCIKDGDHTGAELCKTALVESVEKLKKVNKKKYKVSERLETELKKVLKS